MSLRETTVRYVPRWLLLGNNGAGWLPNISLIAKDLKGSERTRVINNELIHQIQQDELGYFRWVYMYIKFHRKYGYFDNPFERDSRAWDDNPTNRPPRAWELYIPEEDR